MLIGAIALIGYAYQELAEANDARAYPAPGRLVNVAGHKMHINCIGESPRGNPTVILEQGGAGSSLAWFLVQPELARATRVCAYDRAGLGWSESGPEPRHGYQIAEELRALLNEAGVPGPYLLAGWSYGGLFVRAYAARYPDEVVGLALLEASHPEQWTGTNAGQSQYAIDSQIYQLASKMARLGVFRLVPTPLTGPPPGLSPQQTAEWKSVYSTVRVWETTEAESRAILDTMSQVRNAGGLGNLPLTVVSAGQHIRTDATWASYQSDLASLSSNSRHIVVDDATHSSLWSDPAHAVVSATAILELVARITAP